MRKLKVSFRVLVVSILFFSSGVFADNLPKVNSIVDKNPSTSIQQHIEKSSVEKQKKNETKKNWTGTTVSINSATAEEINADLYGIGPSKAKAIVEFRSKNGKFTKLEDLKNVKGIGDATIEKNRAQIILN